MKSLLFLPLFLLFSVGLWAQDKPAYRIFDKAGKPVTYEKMLQQLSKSDVVLFGELHNNSLAHWLQLQVTKDVHKARPKLSLGAEMFEADVQIVLDEYLSRKIEHKHLETEGKIWNNYKTDYKPLVQYAFDHQLPFIATNIPRRYANLVYRKGLHYLDSLSIEAKKYIAPLPITVDLELPGYKNMMGMMGGHGNPESAANLARSQASKDATMAHFIHQNRNGRLFIHYNGSYHSNHFEGINWYLLRLDPNVKILTINTVEQDSIDKVEEKNLQSADFIICIPADMTKTY
jgi:uncharacterized iron-regulated protein